MTKLWTGIPYIYDIVGDVPKAAKSSIAFSTSAKYELDDPDNASEFYVESEAKVIFLSNDIRSEHPRPKSHRESMNERRYLERAVHKVFQHVIAYPNGILSSFPPVYSKVNNVDVSRWPW